MAKGKRAKMPAPRELCVADAASEAIGELTALGQEFREICDNTPDSLQQTQTYQTRDETASTLEDINEPDYPDSLKEIKVTIQDPRPLARGYSRGARCAQACAILGDCCDALEAVAQDDKSSTELIDDATSLKDELENIQSDAENCEFPGMYG